MGANRVAGNPARANGDQNVNRAGPGIFVHAYPQPHALNNHRAHPYNANAWIEDFLNAGAPPNNHNGVHRIYNYLRNAPARQNGNAPAVAAGANGNRNADGNNDNQNPFFAAVNDNENGNGNAANLNPPAPNPI